MDDATSRKVYMRRGEKGPDGSPGARGKDGKDGVRGEDGHHGETGPQGEVGPCGERGYQGENGIPGQIGKTGDRGDAGRDGATIDGIETDGKRIRLVFGGGASKSPWQELDIVDGKDGENGTSGVDGKDGESVKGKDAPVLAKFEARGLDIVGILDDGSELPPFRFAAALAGGSGAAHIPRQSSLREEILITEDYNATIADFTIVGAATVADISVTLPSPAVAAGRVLFIACRYDSTFSVSLVGIVNGDAGGFSLSNSESLTIQSVSDGEGSHEWLVVA